MKILKKIICICLVAILAAGLFPGAQTEVYAAGKPVQLVSCKLNSGGSKVPENRKEWETSFTCFQWMPM